MDPLSSISAVGGASDALGVAIQKKVLDQAAQQGANVAKLIASAPAPAANLPHQGQHVDALA
jgi:hypothetical protein